MQPVLLLIDAVVQIQRRPLSHAEDRGQKTVVRPRTMDFVKDVKGHDSVADNVQQQPSGAKEVSSPCGRLK